MVGGKERGRERAYQGRDNHVTPEDKHEEDRIKFQGLKDVFDGGSMKPQQLFVTLLFYQRYVFPSLMRDGESPQRHTRIQLCGLS